MIHAPLDAVNLHEVALEPAPIEPTWILAGRPAARAGTWSVSSDTTTSAFVWDCTAGRFRWYFGGDELVAILEGEVTVTDEAGALRTLRPGDGAMFRAGTWSTWEVPSYVKKIAICRDTLPRPVVLSLRAAQKVSRLAGRLRRLAGLA